MWTIRKPGSTGVAVLALLVGLGACGDKGMGKEEPECGNGLVEHGEVCDDGNTTGGDGCSADCLSNERCGNGVVDPNEECDDGNTAGGDGCSADCDIETSCGDGILDTGEECDDGAANSDTAPGACRTSCQLPSCGDGVVDTGEECDDGNTAGGDGCSADCDLETSCGDGILDAGEECDDGAANSDTAPGACRTSCQLPSCGDGVVDTGEVCDDGNTAGGDGCSADCASLETCGNGIVDVGEECDDANLVDWDGCTPACLISELQVNVQTVDCQERPAVAMADDGRFVVVWQSNLQDGDGRGVFARRFDVLGAPLGGEFQVNTYAVGAQLDPTVAMANDGSFVVAWQSAGLGDSDGVYAQRYDDQGTPAGNEFQVNTYITASQREPAAAMAPDGRFVIVWNSDWQDGHIEGIFGQRYDGSGTPDGSEFQVNTWFNSDQREPAVAMAADGSFVVSWVSFWQGGDDGEIWTQRYDAQGAPIGTELHVNSTTQLHQASPALSMAGSGSFVVVWHSYDYLNLDQFAAAGQRFDSQGNPSGGELTIVGPTSTNFPERNPDVAMANDGSHLAIWNTGVGFQFHVYGQLYDAQGVMQGSNLQINTCLSHHKDHAAAAAGTDRFVVAWQSYDQDGDQYGIYVKRFDGQSTPLAVGQ